MHTNYDTREFTHLLLQASVQHLRLTLETLPVGNICIDRFGEIESVDEWTQDILDFDGDTLRGRNITDLFEDKTAKFFQMIRHGTPGYAGRTSLKTHMGEPLWAEIVIAPTLQPNKYAFSLVYTTEV